MARSPRDGSAGGEARHDERPEVRDGEAPVAERGVVIAVENLDPHLWEHQIIRSFGLPDSDIDRHLARLRIGPIVRQLETVDHPNVGMMLDVAHLYLAAHDMGFPYIEVVREAALWVRHPHITDNFGRLDTGRPSEGDHRPYDVLIDRSGY